MVLERKLISYGTKNRYLARRVPKHPNADSKGYVMEHRLVMESHIGRYLNREEVVHHIDENPRNNDISNLQVMTKKDHDSLHMKLRWERRRAQNQEHLDRTS